MMKLSLVFENIALNLRGGDGRVSMLTQTTLLFFLLTLTLTSTSIQRYLTENLDQMLGSDMVLESHSPLDDVTQKSLSELVDNVSRTRLMGITLTFKDRWERVQLKLVDSAYPLQGELTVGETQASPPLPAEKGPIIGEIWLGPRLATKLGARVGDTLTLGGRPLQVSRIIFHEPDRILEGHSVAMRAMVHEDTASNLPLGSSNERFRYLLSADQQQQQKIEAWAKEALPGATLIKKYGGQHPLAGFWKRTENFLGLASVILFFMAAVALDMTNRRWLANMRYRLAIYTSFGTPLRTGITMAGAEWLITFLISLFFAVFIAGFSHSLIIAELQSYFPGLEGEWQLTRALKTVGLVFLLLLALQVPSFIQLRHASLLSLIRSGSESSYVWQRLLWGVSAVTLLAAAYSDNLLLTAMTLAAIIAALAFMIALTWLVLWLGDHWGRRRTGLLPFAFFIMRQRLFAKSAQIMGLGLCGLLLLFTLMLMKDLGGMMESYGRTHDGNLLVSEAQADQIDAIHDWANDTGSQVRQLRPFVSAQLVMINGVSLADYLQTPSDTMTTLQKPIRLSWTDDMPANNRLMGGTWWQNHTDNWQQISTEPEVMTDMRLSYGDQLTYLIDGRSYEFTLVASHAYQPGGGSITFWFQVPGSARSQIVAPTRYMGSMELPETAWDKLAGLWQRYPTLSLVPMKELTERFDRTLGVVTKVTNGYAGMVLLLSLFVLAASVSGYRADDRQKNGLLMSMGLKPADCLWLNFYDWGISALIAATGAVVGTWIAGVLIYDAQFGLNYNPDMLWILGTLTAMVTVVCLVGYIACRGSLRVSVRDLLAS